MLYIWTRSAYKFSPSCSKNTTSSLTDLTVLSTSLRSLLTMLHKLVQKGCRLLKLKNEVINVTNQWVGLCFCSCVCKLYHPPALIFELSLDEKQNIKLLWPYQPGPFYSQQCISMCTVEKNWERGFGLGTRPV